MTKSWISRLSRCLALVFLLLLGTSGLAAASHGPGNVTALAIDPLTPMTLYAGTSDRGVLKSADGGVTWNATGLTSSRITAVAIDPLTSTTLYVGTSDRGVLKSTDGGTIWTATGLSGVVHVLIVDFETPTTLYAVTATAGAFKSTNAGTVWSLFGPPNAPALALAIDPLSPTTMYVGTSDGVYESLDRGVTWASIGLAGHVVSTLASYPPNLYAVTQHGIFETTIGDVWSPGVMIPSAMVPVTPTILYSGTASGAYKSVDGGETWTAVNTGLTDVLVAHQVSTAVGPLVIDPVTQTLYAATALGVFRSVDGAATWRHDSREGECFDGVDDDGDGLVDGADPDCPLSCFNDACPQGYVCNFGGLCEPHCGNGVRDGDEGDIDCGGSCATKCQGGQSCWTSWDCLPGSCSSGICSSGGPGSPPALASLSLDRASVLGGTPSTGTVTLRAAAPIGSVTLTLLSSQPAAATVPGTVTVAAGATTATFTVVTSPVTISTLVTITASAGGESKSTQLTVTAPPRPTIASVTPNRGPVGAVVTVGGTALDSVTDVRFSGGAAAGITSSSASSLTLTVPAGALTGPIILNSPVGATSTATAFTVTPAITAVTPNPAFGGSQVTITGTNLQTGTRSPTVRVGSVVAPLLPGGTASQLRVTLPTGAVTNRVTVTTDDGLATSAADLIVVPRPTVTSFAPIAGPPGTLVTVSGSNLSGVSAVLINGVSAAITPVSATSLRASVPVGATSGPITLLTVAGSVTSVARFTVTPPSDLVIPTVATPASAAIGRSLSVGTTIRNAGGSPSAASVLRIYISADHTVDANDRLLTTRAVSALAAGASMALTTTITVPVDIAPGIYRIIAAVETSGPVPEGDTTNNVGVSAPLSITPYSPNLAVTVLTPPARGAVGQPITVPNTVRNTGPAPAGPFAIRFHLSADAVLDSGDPAIGLRTLGSLAAGVASPASTSLRLPDTIAAGQYYIIAVADALEQQMELDETNKVTVSGLFAVVPYQPELALTALTVPAWGAIGQTIGVTNTVGNTGLAPAGPFTVRFHLSHDRVLDGGDPLVGTRSLGGLAPGSASGTPTSLRIPTTTPEGEYYVIAVVDAAEQQAELDETNNTTVSAPFGVGRSQPLDDEPECRTLRPLSWVRPAACSGDGGDGEEIRWPSSSARQFGAF